MADYPRQHEGPVLVCGSAWTLYPDLRKASVIFPSAPVIAVNGAAAHVAAFALFSGHPRNFPKWIESQSERFGDGFTVHTGGRKNMGAVERYPWVDYWWPDVSLMGTSTWGARKMAKLMGFDLVVLCGAPIDVGTYVNGKMASKAWQRPDAVAEYRRAIESDTAWHDGCRSMSGWTRELLGYP